MFMQMIGGATTSRTVAPPPPTPRCKRVTPPTDADAPEISKDDIVALSKFGFFSIDASAKTTIYVDNSALRRDADDSACRCRRARTRSRPSAEGQEAKEFMITIIGGRDTDEGTITW